MTCPKSHSWTVVVTFVIGPCTFSIHVLLPFLQTEPKDLLIEIIVKFLLYPRGFF